MSNLTPIGWLNGELVRFCEVVGGGTPDRAIHEYWGGQIPWVSPTEITSLGAKYISNTRDSLTQLGLEKSSAKLHPVGTLLMTSRASIGYVAINTVPMATNQGFQSLRCKDGTLVDYMYQYITWVRAELERLAAGSTFSEISSANVKRLRVTLPPLPEQQKIAAILSSVDDVIEKTRAQIDKLKDLKTGMMQELLTKGIGHIEFKDSLFGRVPVGWCLLTLDDMGVDDQPVLRTGPFGSSLKSKDFQKKGTPVINIQNLGVGRLEKANLYYISDEKALELQSYKVSSQDLVFSRVADVGRSVVIPEKAAGWIISSNLMKISVDTDRINPKYLMYQLVNGPVVSYQLRQMVADGGRPVVTGSLIKQIVFPIPSIEEQKEIVKKMDSIDSFLRSGKDKIAMLFNLKKAFMQDLLTGKVRVNVD